MTAALLVLSTIILTPEFFHAGEIYADGSPIEVQEDSAPQFADWNNDGLPDLIVAERLNGQSLCDFRLYINSGQPDSPILTYSSMLEENGETLLVPGTYAYY